MAQRTFFATFIGGMAAEALAGQRDGYVMGLTSKGIFLRCGEFVLFITDAPYKSPFNLYVPGFERLMDALALNSPFEVLPGSLRFPTEALQIVTENAEVWTPGFPTLVRTTAGQRKDKMLALLEHISSLEAEKGWLFLHNHVPSFPAEVEERILVNTRLFSDAYLHQQMVECLAAAGHLLGLGGGLTPSGDDWLAGFILYQARLCQAQASAQPFLESLKQELLQLAAQKTTTISTNRILAAGRGWAEEPFLQVIDALFSGEDFPEGLAELLVRFGHSSGVDTTLGIFAALQAE